MCLHHVKFSQIEISAFLYTLLQLNSTQLTSEQLHENYDDAERVVDRLLFTCQNAVCLSRGYLQAICIGHNYLFITRARAFHFISCIEMDLLARI